MNVDRTENDAVAGVSAQQANSDQPQVISVPESSIVNNRCAADGYRAFLKNQGSEGGSDLENLERQLEGAIDTLWQSAVIVENFSEPSQEQIFHANVRKYMNHLSNISQIASKIDIEIPVRVLTKIDSGGNPDLVTKELAEVCSAKNDETRGRIFYTRIFRDIFKAQLDAWIENSQID